MYVSLRRGFSALVAATLVCTGALGCSGGQSTRGPSTRASASNGSSATPNLRQRAKLDSDADSDFNRNHDDYYVTHFGHAATAAERGAIVGVVERYYAATSAKNGHAACTMLTDFWVKGMAEQAGAGQSQGDRCGAAVTESLKALTAQTDAHQAKIDVVVVRARGDHARVVVRGSTGEERWVPLTRQGNAWKVASLYDVLLE